MFCHVVETSHDQDFELIKNVTTTLRDFGSQQSTLTGVQKIFDTLLALSEQLIKDSHHLRVTPGATGSSVDINAHKSGIHGGQDSSSSTNQSPLELNRSADETSVMPQVSNLRWLSDQSSSMDMFGSLNTLSEYDLMQGLYDSQPSLQWIEGLHSEES